MRYMEVRMIGHRAMLSATFAVIFTLFGPAARSAEGEDQAALVKAVSAAKVSLQQGLAASGASGQPISGKFEIENGKLQLSVYTAKDGKFFEVLVDYTTGATAKVEPITEGDDLAAAKTQSAAMAKARTQLKEAVDKATGQASATRAVSVVPELKDGHAVASIALLKGNQLETITEKLD
jgi:hypothetical protein